MLEQILHPNDVAILSLKLHESIEIIGMYSELSSFIFNAIPAPSHASFELKLHESTDNSFNHILHHHHYH